jgi:hypothetical protein
MRLTNARPTEIEAARRTIVSMTCAATSASRTSREPRLPLEARVPNVWARPASSDGRTPKSNPLKSDAAIAKHSTRPSKMEYACVARGAG